MHFQTLRLTEKNRRRWRGAVLITASVAAVLIGSMVLPGAGLASTVRAPSAVRRRRASIPAPDPSLWGRTVLHVQLQTDSGLELSRFRSLIEQKTGTPLDPVEVSRSLKNLYATGRFHTLRADARPIPGGVVLVFAGKAEFFIGTVRVRETSKALPESELASSARLTLGRPLLPGDLDTAQKNVEALLMDNSYYKAQVSYSVRRRPEVELADILFTVNPGAPARLGDVIFAGASGFSAARLRSAAGWRRGRILTPEKLQHGLFEIHRFLAQKGFLAAAVSIERREFQAASNTVRLNVQINEGPRVRVSIEGARISKSQMQKALAVIFQEGLTDDLSLDAGARDLANSLAEQGYFYARAQWRRIRHPGALDIVYVVEPGPQMDFAGYSFSGNSSFPSDVLAPLVTLQTPGLLSHTHGVFSHSLLSHDVNALETFYKSKGFSQASVSPDERRSDGQLSVIFNIHEGIRTRVKEVAFHGAEAEMVSQFRPSLAALPGKPFSMEILNKDRDAILTFFADHGYPGATVDPHVSTVAPHSVEISYEIHPGQRQFVGSVVILGNQHTRTGVIRRQLSFKRGEPLSEAAIYSSQRKLYDLGLFNSVQIAPQDPGRSEASKTMLVNVDEADRWTLGYGFGLDVQRLGGNQPSGELRASPRLSLEATRINVGGRDQTFSLRGRVSDLETGGEADYLISNFFNRPQLSLRVGLLADQTRDVLTFTSKLEQASLTLEKQFSASTFLLGRYNYRLVSVSSLRINPEEVPLVSQPVRDAGFGSTFIHDTRDDPADATRGSYSLLDASISSATVGSEASFVRFLGQNSTYYHVAPHLVFARNTQFGVESAYGKLRSVALPGQTILTDQIPLAERFFAGGSDSLRAFSLNQAGPRDPVTGYPIGGDALFVNSLELRMPFRQGRYGVVLFNDTGNVYSAIDKMRLLKFTQTSPTDLNYTVDAVGAGFRYKTPIGPIRLDLAYGLNVPRYQIAPEHGPTEVLRLPRFQYFISIGQSF